MLSPANEKNAEILRWAQDDSVCAQTGKSRRVSEKRNSALPCSIQATVILSPSAVILSPSLVILSPSLVILSEAKDLSSPAQGKLREGSRQFAQGGLREGSPQFAQGKLHEGSPQSRSG